MQLPRLEIHNTFAQLGFSTRKATLEIRQQHGELHIRQPKAEMEIRKSGGTLQIDQSEAFADANLKHPFRVISEWAQKAKQKVLRSLAEEAAEGDRLMKIENSPGTTVIPQIAKEESEDPPKEFNIGWMPSSAEKIKFTYDRAKINLDVREGKVSVKGIAHQPIMKYNRGDFQIYLKQKAQMDIQAVNTSINKII